MRPEVSADVQDWLRRSSRDILAARRVLQEPDPLADVAVFHAQQAAEKALKAFLTAQGEVFAKTHDLGLLVRQCQNFEPEFARFLPAADTLTPYAVRFRYPGGPLEPDLAEAKQAIQLTTELVAFVEDKLTIQVGP